MQPTADLQIVTVILQAGAFGLLLVASVWIGRYLVPKAFETYDKMQARHDVALERQEIRFAAQELKRDVAFDKMNVGMATLASTLGQVAQVMQDVADRLEEVEHKTGEHPLPSHQPKKRP